jgi:hypothetical protein
MTESGERPSAIDGFLAFDCDDDLAARLRREIAEARGVGYDEFNFNTFDIELFYAENRVKVAEAVELGYEDAEVSVGEFLAALPDVPAGERMHDRPRRVIIPPAPEN